MHRLIGFAAFLILAAGANAQDTAVVVRHIGPQQDTTVTVRHIAPAPARPYGAPRYALRSTGLIAKDPGVATSLSFIFPGGGQYYADMPGKGLAITAIAIGAPIVGYPSVDRTRDYTTCYNSPFNGQHCGTHRDYTPAAIGLGVGIATWLYGIATAGPDAQRWNRAHGVRFVNIPGRVGFAVAVP
jgi:TM2 domain-containing membrane protein YozV